MLDVCLHFNELPTNEYFWPRKSTHFCQISKLKISLCEPFELPGRRQHDEGQPSNRAPHLTYKQRSYWKAKNPQPEHLPNVTLCSPPRTGTKRPSNKLENYEISWAPFTYESQFRESTLAALAFHKSNFSAGLAFNAPTKSYGYNHLKDLSLQISIDHNQKMSKTSI